MVQDSRWPALPLMAIRGVQLFFTILVLGMSGYLVSLGQGYVVFWGYSMALTAAVLTLVYIGINFVLFFMNLLLPLAIVIVDAIITIFWIVALGGLGDTRYLPLSCSWTEYGYFLETITYTSIPCRVVKAAFGLSFLLFLSFIGTLVLAAITLHKNRKDLRGAKYNSGLDPEGNPLPGANVAVAMGAVQPNDYYQEPKPEYAPAPQPTATPGYYDHQHQHQQHPIISPPATPAPYSMPSQGYNMPQQPSNAAEMPGR